MVDRMRKAFTLIELIFALVVISVVITSIPIIMRTTAKSIEDNLVQEAIFATSTQLMETSSLAWDKNSYADLVTSGLFKVVDIYNDCNTTTRQRIGHINRMCLDINSTSPAVDLSMESRSGSDEALIASFVNGDAQGYKQNYTMDIDILPSDIVDGGFGAYEDDIKKVSISIKDEDNGDELVKMYLYSTNIGSFPYYKKRL
ncbi:MAG: type II secretion system protein [Sulfuricurvum sp.]